jgi:hypothetical protein
LALAGCKEAAARRAIVVADAEASGVVLAIDLTEPFGSAVQACGARSAAVTISVIPRSRVTVKGSIREA